MADLEKGILKIRYFYMYILNDENAFKDFNTHGYSLCNT